MKPSFYSASAWLLIGCVAALAAHAQTIDVGRIQASHGVSSNGGFTYTIPITLPPGPHGVTPQLSLVYDSSVDSNPGDDMPLAGTSNVDEIPAGAGWVLEGLSEIERTNKTEAQDGNSLAVGYSPSDAYEVDGSRLRLTSSDDYGEDGSTYQTEVANFAQYTAHGASGSGPDYWTAQLNGGVTYEYGNTTSSQLSLPGGSSGQIRAWLLDKVSDVNGNNYTITYGVGASGSVGIGMPTSISWTLSGSGSSTYEYTATLQYEARQNPITNGTIPNIVENNNLLESITISYNGSPIRIYKLTYTTSSTTGNSLLQQVQECDGEQENCLNPTTFSYYDTKPGVGSTPESLPGGSTGDFNGDGISDFLYSSGGTYYVAFGNGSGGFNAVSTTIGSSSTALVGDLLHQGKDGILADISGTWWYYTYNGTAFTGVSTHLTVQPEASFTLADLDGNGLPDLIATHVAPWTGPGTGNTVAVYEWQNTSTSGTPSFDSTQTNLLNYVGGSLEIVTAAVWGQASVAPFVTPFDFTGDGRKGLLMEVNYNGNSTELFELLSNGSGSLMTVNGISTAPTTLVVAPQVLSWNDDKCTDIAWNDYNYSASASEFAVYVSPCGSGSDSTTGSIEQLTSTVPGLPIVGAAGWDGDGSGDVLVDNGGTIGIYPSSGDGVGTLITTDVPISSGGSVIPLNVTGSGLPDLAAGGDYYAHNSVVAQPDLMQTLTDGNGNTIQPSYAPLAAGPYTLGTSTLQYPESNWDGDLWVVKSLTLPEGTGSTYTESYQYQNARWSALRGFEGFSQITVKDSRSNAPTNVTSYSQLFPLTGLVSEQEAYQSGGTTPISNSTYSNTEEELSSTQYEERYFVYPSSVTTDRYEVGGSENTDWITASTTAYASPDEYGNFPTVTTTVTEKDPGSPYVGDQWVTETQTSVDADPSTWCVSLPSSVSVTQTAAGEPALTHTTTFTPDETNCREDSETQSAGNSAYDVTTAFSYDAFGNVKQETVTGTGMAARTSTYNWGPTGQFQEVIQDPVAYQDGYEEKIGYDFGTGVKTSDEIESTGGTANAPATTWTDDWLGRITQEKFPDGTALKWSYTACSSTTCYNSAYELVKEIAYDSNSETISEHDADKDTFGRTVASTTELMDGTDSLVEQTYDAFGNILTKSALCPAAGGACSDWTQTTYDALNRPTQIVSPAPWTSGGEATTAIAYAGGTITVTNANNQENKRISDVSGAVRETRDATGYGQNFILDSDGNVIEVTDYQGNTLTTQSYDYGGMGDYLASRTDYRGLGSWNYTPDALGDVTEYTDAKGQTFRLWYDGLGRPTEREDEVGDSSGVTCTGTDSVCETDTHWTWGSTPSLDNVGHLAQAQTITADGTYTEVDSYGALSRLKDRTITIPGDATYQYVYSYNAQGLLYQLQYPMAGSFAGPLLTYGYEHGALASVTDAVAGTVYWQANTVNVLGEVTEDTLGNGIVTQTGYTTDSGWPSRVTAGPSGSATAQNQTFSYDALGNVTLRQNNNGSGLTENVYYDPDNRLSYSTLQTGSGTATTNLQMEYNSDGGINQKTETGGTDTPVGYTVSWTSYNYPRSISATLSSGESESATFDYGPNRSRWRMVYTEGTASETTEYIGGLMEKVTSTLGTNYRYYIRGSNGLAAIHAINASDTVSTDYALEDQEASLAALLNSTGSTAVDESFTAFGVRREASTWSGPPTSTEESTMDSITRQGFTGQTVLGQMGLNHMNGRVQDAISGTFLSPDPNVTDPNNTQDYDRYTYVYDNPVTNVDPTGFQECGVETGLDGINGCIDTTDPNDPCYEIAGCIEPGAGDCPVDSQYGCIDPPPTPTPPPQPPPQPVWDVFPQIQLNPLPQGAGGAPQPQLSAPCGGAGGPNSNSAQSQADQAAIDTSLTVSDLGLQAADKFTKNVKAPPNVNLGAIGVLSKGMTFIGLAISAYQAVFGSSAQARELGAQDTAVNGFGTAVPAAAPFTAVPYDLGRTGRELYDAYKNLQADEILLEAAQCPSAK